MTSERTRFERWALDNGFDIETVNAIDDVYRNHQTINLWLAWQQARTPDPLMEECRQVLRDILPYAENCEAYSKIDHKESIASAKALLAKLPTKSEDL